MIAVCVYILAQRIKFAWNYTSTLIFWFILKILSFGMLRQRILNDPIEKVVEDYERNHPKLKNHFEGFDYFIKMKYKITQDKDQSNTKHDLSIREMDSL